MGQVSVSDNKLIHGNEGRRSKAENENEEVENNFLLPSFDAKHEVNKMVRKN